MLLSCRHILALRRKLGEPLFAAELCDQRWTAAYYKSTQRLFSSSSAEPTLELVTSSKEHQRKLSQRQKFRKASIITNQLASVASEALNVHFKRRLNLLEDLLIRWKEGDEVALVDADEGEC